MSLRYCRLLVRSDRLVVRGCRRCFITGCSASVLLCDRSCNARAAALSQLSCSSSSVCSRVQPAARLLTRSSPQPAAAAALPPECGRKPPARSDGLLNPQNVHVSPAFYTFMRHGEPATVATVETATGCRLLPASRAASQTSLQGGGPRPSIATDPYRGPPRSGPRV